VRSAAQHRVSSIVGEVRQIKKILKMIEHPDIVILTVSSIILAAFPETGEDMKKEPI
jgi:hypothetical protein